MSLGSARASPALTGGRRLRADVAERRQPLAIFVGDGGRRVDVPAGHERVERGPQRRRRLPALGGDVRALAGIALEVVQLLARRLDVAEAIVGQRQQLAPAEVIARIERLGVDALRRDGCRDRGARPTDRGREGPAERPARRAPRASAAGRCAAPAPSRGVRPTARRELHDPRHADDLVVEEQPVLFFDVVAEPFAVIGEHDDRGVVVPAARLQAREQRADDLVRERDLAVVGGKIARIGRARGTACAARRGAGRGRSGPTSASAATRRPRPASAARPLDLCDRSIGGHRRKRRVVDVEALPDAGLGAQHVGRDEPAGLVSRRAEHRGQRRRARSFSVNPRLSRTLCSNGRCPVNIDACDGSVCGACA